METATKSKCKFHIGQKVTRRAFIDCFHKEQPAITGLTVYEIEREQPGCMPDWFRIKAIGENGRGWASGSETFFELAEVEQTLTGLESAAAEG